MDTCPEFATEEGHVCEMASSSEEEDDETPKSIDDMNEIELIEYFRDKNWDYSHIDFFVMEQHPKKKKKRAKLRLIKYKEFAKKGPYEMKYLREKRGQVKEDAYPTKESPKPPDFANMSERQLSEFCDRLGIYTGDIDPDLVHLKTRLDIFKIAEGKHAEDDISSLESAHQEYQKHLAELKVIAVELNDLDIPAGDPDNRYMQQHIDECKGLVEKLPEKEPKIFVFGDASAGKTTFINLLLEAELLPVSIEMGLTSTICEIRGVRDHNQARIEATKKDGAFVPSERLTHDDIVESQSIIRRFAAEDNKDDPQYSKVDILWPCPLLNSGICLLDSPGLNDAKPDDEEQWWINRVKMHVQDSIATICILRPPGVSETVASCLRDLVKTQRNNDDYNPESIFFVVTHLDTVKIYSEQVSVIKDMKKRLATIVPNCPLDTNFVPVNLFAASNARRWKLYSPEHAKLMSSLELFFEGSFKAYLLRGWGTLYTPVHQIYVDIHDQHQAKTVDQNKARQELRKRRQKLDKFMEAYKKAEKKYQRDVGKIDKQVCSKVKDLLQKNKASVIEQTSKVHINYEKDDLKVSGKTAIEFETEIYIGGLKRVMKKEIGEKLEEYLHTTALALVQLAIKGTEDIRRDVDELQEELKPDGIESFSESLSDLLEYLNPKQKASMIMATGFAISGTVIAIGIGTSLIVPVVGWAVGGTILVLQLSFLMYKGIKKWRRFSKIEEKIVQKYEELLEANEILKLLAETLQDLKKPANQVWILVIDEIRSLDDRLENINNLLGSPRACRSFGELRQIKTKMNEIQNSLQRFRFLNLIHPNIKNERFVLKEELPAGPLGDAQKSYSVQHCIMIKPDVEYPDAAAVIVPGAPGDPANEEKELLDGVNVIVKTYYLGSSNAAISLSRDRLFLRHFDDHEHLASFYGFRKTPDGNLQLITEYISEGSLSDWITKFGDEMSFSEYIDIAVGIAEGMKEICRQNKLHGNIRPENIMVSTEGDKNVVKVGRHYANDDKESNLVALKYQAPEVVLGAKIEKRLALDVYSFGVVLWEMWYHVKPFSEILTLEKFVDFFADGGKLSFESKVPQKLRFLVESCCNGDCWKRPSWHQIIYKLRLLNI